MNSGLTVLWLKCMGIVYFHKKLNFLGSIRYIFKRMVQSLPELYTARSLLYIANDWKVAFRLRKGNKKFQAPSEIKSWLTASVQLSTYADWLQTHKQTPQTGNDSYSQLHKMLNGAQGRPPCQISRSNVKRFSRESVDGQTLPSTLYLPVLRSIPLLRIVTRYAFITSH